MKYLINGKTYNTDTSTVIGIDDTYFNRGDFRFECTHLYQTKKGAFFIAGEGGPLSRWGQACGNGMSGGSGAEALTRPEALDWCQQNRVCVDKVLATFDVEEA